MMDLTPLDVRKKKGDFRRGLRGYEAAQVDDFLDLVADRMEAIVRQAAPLMDRVAQLEQQVKDYRDRERALTEALVSAQQMREDIKSQSTREVEMLRRQAEQEADQIRAEAEKDRQREEHAIQALRARQIQFLQSYRTYLEQELSELAAMNRAIEMHAANPAASAAAAHDRAERAKAPVSGTTHTPAPSDPSPGAPAVQAPAVTLPAAVQAAPAAMAASQPSVPARDASASGTAVADPPARPQASGPLAGTAADGESAGGIEGLLDQALARWEPELEPAEEVEVATVIHEAEPVEDGGAEDLELLLSDEDVVSPDQPAEQATVVELTAEEAAVDLAFLDFDDDTPTAVSEPEVVEEARPAADPAVVDREVTAAMGDTDADFIEIGNAFSGQETDDSEAMESSADPTAAVDEDFEIELDHDVESAADSSIDALFEDEAASGVHEVREPVDGGNPAPSGSESEADFVDAVVFDAETAFNEEPSGNWAGPHAAAGSPPAADMPAAVGFDDDFDAFDVEAGHTNAGEVADEAADDLIDMNAYSAVQDTSPGRTEEDVTSLTLHPMFFEEEPTDMPGVADGHEHGHEEVRQDQWSSSGGG